MQVDQTRLWAILVPRYSSDGEEWDASYHREWDRRVSEITGGLTILPSVDGRWGDMKERNIVVQVACGTMVMAEIALLTAEYYHQEAVLYWLVSEEAMIGRVR